MKIEINVDFRMRFTCLGGSNKHTWSFCLRASEGLRQRRLHPAPGSPSFCVLGGTCVPHRCPCPRCVRRSCTATWRCRKKMSSSGRSWRPRASTTTGRRRLNCAATLMVSFLSFFSTEMTFVCLKDSKTKPCIAFARKWSCVRYPN